jgi:hypothetical protein
MNTLTLNDPRQFVVLIEIEEFFIIVQRRNPMRWVTFSAERDIRQIQT